MRVWLNPKSRRVKPKDVPQFREELYEFLARENGLGDPEWEHPQGFFNRIFLFNPYEVRKVLQVYPVRVGKQASSHKRVTGVR